MSTLKLTKLSGSGSHILCYTPVSPDNRYAAGILPAKEPCGTRQASGAYSIVNQKRTVDTPHLRWYSIIDNCYAGVAARRAGIPDVYKEFD